MKHGHNETKIYDAAKYNKTKNFPYASVERRHLSFEIIRWEKWDKPREWMIK